MEVVMETKAYNSKLRAVLSIRNFNKVLEKHYEQMLEIESSLNELNNNATALIRAHSSPGSQERWDNIQSEMSKALTAINQVLKTAKEKVKYKNRSHSIELWERYDLFLQKFKETFQMAEVMGFEILPKSEHIHWRKDIINYEDTILPLIVSHAEACRVELEMIERYTPRELDFITQIVSEHIPDNFNFEDADKYEYEYLNALEEFKKEFRKEKNLWDKFLDILAGGTHQSPSERVMMQRWLNGEKQEL